jgi:hypothetical protein
MVKITDLNFMLVGKDFESASNIDWYPFTGKLALKSLPRRHFASDGWIPVYCMQKFISLSIIGFK